MKKIGVLGGGQLGLMLHYDWEKFLHKVDSQEYELWFLGKKNCPISKVTDHFKEGDYENYADVMQFGMTMDIITIEIEKVSVQALYELEKMGKHVYPQPRVIELIQDKGLQKKLYKESGIPTAEYTIYEDEVSILQDITPEYVYPFVQKARKGGYDGGGVKIIRSEKDLIKLFTVPSIVEEFIHMDKELSVIVMRTDDGRLQCYDPVEMEFDPEANILKSQIAPALISDEVAQEAEELAMKVADILEIVGILAVELFLTPDGRLLVNEVAPRPHNSGHHTRETTECSQYEQLLLMITGHEYGNTDLKQASILLNILGEGKESGLAQWIGLTTLILEDVYVTSYYKETCKPGRKMGHVVITGPDDEVRKEKVGLVKEKLHVVALIK